MGGKKLLDASRQTGGRAGLWVWGLGRGRETRRMRKRDWFSCLVVSTPVYLPGAQWKTAEA